VPDYTLVDATLHYELAGLAPSLRGLRLALNVANLLDERHVASCVFGFCNVGLQRSVISTVTYRW
jgi:iron complex outermembrane recepter protein